MFYQDTDQPSDVIRLLEIAQANLLDVSVPPPPSPRGPTSSDSEEPESAVDGNINSVPAEEVTAGDGQGGYEPTLTRRFRVIVHPYSRAASNGGDPIQHGVRVRLEEVDSSNTNNEA